MYGRRLAITTATIALTAGVAAAPASAGAPKAPPGTKAVTPSGTGTRYDQLDLLAGSSSELLYISRADWAGDLDPDPNHETTNATPELTLRDRDGTTHDLGTASQDSAWSTEGSLVTGLRYGAKGPIGLVDVWSVGPHGVAHRVVNVPTTVEKIGTTPTGFVYADGDTLRAWNAATQTRSSLGVPFPGQTISTLRTSQRNLVVTGSVSGVSLMSYSQPATYTPLNSGPGTAPVFCYALDAEGAACAQTSNLLFVPLTGGAPTVSGNEGMYYIAMSGSEILYTSDSSDSTRLYGFSAGNPTTVESTDAVDFVVVSAYGKVLLRPVDLSNHHVLQASSTTTIHNAFAIPHSPETAGPFSLSGSSITYISDLRDRSHPNQPLRVRSINIHASTSHVSLGKPQDVAKGHGGLQIYPAAVAKDGSNIAYVAATFKQFAAYPRVVVRTLRHTVQLPGAVDIYGGVQVVGDLVAYRTGSSVGLYNVRTGHFRKVVKRVGSVSFALTPTRIFYGDSNHGAVKSVDLATGRTTTVFRRPGGKFAQVDVVAIGNRVAWDMTINPTRQLDGMRTVPSGSVVRLPYSPYAMTAAGVVMKSVDPSNHELTDVWFLPFGGSVHRLMSARMFDELPQLVGHALAWVSVDGNLKVAPYKY